MSSVKEFAATAAGSSRSKSSRYSATILDFKSGDSPQSTGPEKVGGQHKCLSCTVIFRFF